MNTALSNGNIAFPEDFEKRMKQTLDAEDWSAFVAAHSIPAPVSIRLHPRKNFKGTASPVPWSNMGRYLDKRPVFTLDPAFHGGAYYVQEASSMFLEQAFRQLIDDKNETLTILDLSAAPGGKSTHILSLISEASLLVSNEVIRSRANILSENIQKWGYPNCIVTNNDPADFSQLHGLFDVIVVDAPCSGEGLFRKDPKAMNEWSAENVNLCSARQQRILHDVWPALKENGILIYSTCTYSAQENEDNLQRFANESEVSFLRLQTDPAWGVELIEKGDVVGYRFLPHHVTGEGFFLAVLQKKQTTATTRSRHKSKLTLAPKKSVEKLSSWIHHVTNFNFYQHQDLIFVLPAFQQQQIDTIINSLRFIYGGTNVATVKHEKYIPEHALALSTIINRDQFNVLDVDLETAIRYLRRDTIELPESPLGFTLVTNDECALGWANVIANRVNNLYPQDWRIRMSG